MALRCPLLLIFLGALHCTAQTASHPTSCLTVATWKSQLPFNFKYGGRDSSQFISTWTRTEETTPSAGGELNRFTFTDPATRLKVTAEVRTFTNYDAVDCVLKFSNEGSADTPIIEDIHPVSWDLTSLPLSGGVDCPEVHWPAGGRPDWQSFYPQIKRMEPTMPLEVGCLGGRSSQQQTPFFNVVDLVWNGVGYDTGKDGFIAAIGWTGNWVARFSWNQPARIVNFQAGMKATHLVLHPGESIRTPRVILMNWHGAMADSQNVWRRLILAYYSPPAGAGRLPAMPVMRIVPGRAPAGAFHPFGAADVTGLDAGWYGSEKTDVDWVKNRGTWTPDPKLYPNGLAPLGAACKKAGHGLLLWMEPEVADAGSALLREHPGWFLPATGDVPALLNMGDPTARKGITELVSNLITESGATWLQHEFTCWPEKSWAAADAPDRIGMTEIKYIIGLYQFWDDLRALHPGLVIDNGGGLGGTRVDIEAMSRGVEVMAAYPKDAVGEQLETQQLRQWVPLGAGRLGYIPPGVLGGSAGEIYTLRSSYGPGWVIGVDQPVDATILQAIEEFRRVRPYFTGDFYPLLRWGYENQPSTFQTWGGWQLHRSDLRAGVALLLRRDKSDFFSVQPALHSIDPNGRYEVEIRRGLGAGETHRMPGAELARLQVTIRDEPGSALIFYNEL